MLSLRVGRTRGSLVQVAGDWESGGTEVAKKHAALEIILLKCYRFVNLQVHGFIIFIFISVNMLDMSYLNLMVCLEKTVWEYCSQRFTVYTALVLHWSRGFQLISQHFVHCLVRTDADSSCTIFPQTW